MERISALENKVDTSPALVAQELKRSFNIEGIQQVTASELDKLIQSSFATLEANFNSKFNLFLENVSNRTLLQKNDTPVIDTEATLGTFIPKAYRFP